MDSPGWVKFALPTYPETYASHAGDVCVGIGYKLNADGTTSDFTMLKAWSDNQPKQGREQYWQAFACAASDVVAQWKFVPRAGVSKPSPVYTVATFVFSQDAVATARKECVISNLARHIYELKGAARTRPDLMPPIFDELALDQAEEQIFRNKARMDSHARMTPKLEAYRETAQRGRRPNREMLQQRP